MSKEDILVTTTDYDVVFTTGEDTVYAPIVEGIETFPVDAIETLVAQDFSSKCTVSRAAVLNLLDRLSLFVVPYDKQGIYLTFNEEGILFSSKKSSGQELIPYITSNNFSPYSCCINIEMLRSQIACQDLDAVELYYGSEVAIKMVSGNKGKVVAASWPGKIKTICMMIGVTLVFFYNMPFAFIGGGIRIDYLFIFIATIMSVVSACQYYLANKDFIFSEM